MISMACSPLLDNSDAILGLAAEGLSNAGLDQICCFSLVHILGVPIIRSSSVVATGRLEGGVNSPSALLVLFADCDVAGTVSHIFLVVW
jgi:hypothetical protein